jgi:large subunit ribosomal protein L10
MRAEKKQLVQDIGTLLTSSGHVIFVSYKGLKVADFSDFRQGLAKVGAECHVIPNRLLRKAAEVHGLTSLAEATLTHDNAMISGGEDAVAVAKVVRDFAKSHDAVNLKIGALDGRLLKSAEIEDLAALPSREILLAQLLGVLQAPARNLVGVLHAKTASVVYALQAYLDKK